MSRRTHDQMRLRLAQQAEQILLESGSRDFHAAKQKAAQQIFKSGMNVRQAEQLVRRLQEEHTNPASKVKEKDPDVRHLEESLSERLGTHVEIKIGSRGKGKLVIDFHGNDVLQGILEKIH